MEENDIILFDGVSGVTAIGSTFNDASFEDKKFMATSVPTSTSITITMPSNETGTQLNNSGDATGKPFYHVGPSQQLGGFGWGTANFGGTASGIATTTLATALTDTTTTNIVIANSTAFPDAGEIRIGTEDISYTTNNTTTNILSGGAREVNGTTKAAHSGGVTVTNISDFVAWGEASSADFTIDPGLWVLDNFGTKLIALIYNNRCFEWDSAATNATSIRATIIANAPTASRHVLVSTPDRHLVFFGTETTVGSQSSQDAMFIRFSDQENIDGSEAYTVTAENTAGTQRLAATLNAQQQQASRGGQAERLRFDSKRPTPILQPEFEFAEAPYIAEARVELVEAQCWRACECAAFFAHDFRNGIVVESLQFCAGFSKDAHGL